MTSMLETKPAWERITHGDEIETDASWAAFQIYRDMPIWGNKKERRTYPNLAKKLDHKSITTVAGWGSKFKWRERARKYDEYNGDNIMALKQLAHTEYKKEIIQQLTEQTSAVAEVINKSIQALLKATEEDKPVSSKELNALLVAIERNDNLSRRAVGLPTSYTSDVGESVGEEEEVIYTARVNGK